MKNLLVIATATLSLGAVAQENKIQDSKKNQEKELKNEIMMKDGRITVMKDGKAKTMNKDIIMPNGSIISPDGIVKMKNGKTMQLRNGELIVIRANPMKMEK